MRTRVLLDMDVKPSFDAADVARWSGGVWRAAPAHPVSGVSIDTRTLQPGDLFVAIRGEKSDGHAFVATAIANGAGAVMVEDESSLRGLNIPAIVVSSTRTALLQLARGYRATWKCRMISVTGSVGKTTVKELIADMLHHVGVTARTKGNWNNDLGVPLSLLASRPDSEFGVFEVGMNHPGELDPLCEIISPDVGLVTCIGPVHIEHFEDEAAIAHEKAAVYRALGGKGIAVVNRDDPYSEVMRADVHGNRMVTVSAKPGADYVYRRNDPARGIFEISEAATGEHIEIEAPLPGEYFVLDAVLAAATVRSLGVGWPVIRAAIQHFRPLSMRWNRHVWFGVHTINDAYNANPVSMKAAVQAFLEEQVKRRRWVVLAGMLELGSDEQARHEELGRLMVTFNDVNLVTVGPRGAWIARGAIAAGMNSANVHAMADSASAARFLVDALGEGDAILLKGSRGESVEEVLRAWVKLKEAQNEGIQPETKHDA